MVGLKKYFNFAFVNGMLCILAVSHITNFNNIINMKRLSFIALFTLVAMLLMPNLMAQTVQEVKTIKNFSRSNYEIPAFSNRYFMVDKLSDGSFVITPYERKKYLLLPVNDAAPFSVLKFRDYEKVVFSIDIHLTNTDNYYYVPVDLEQYRDYKEFKVIFSSVTENDLFWKYLKAADDLSEVATANYLLHHSLNNEWNGRLLSLFYRDGKYHLYYQTSKYGNTSQHISVGHSVSNDLFSWQSQPLLMPFDNKFYANGIAAFSFKDHMNNYLSMLFSASDGGTKSFPFFAQCTENGNNIQDIVEAHMPNDGILRLFKVIRKPNGKNFILVAADESKICFYSSENLFDWEPYSCFENPLFKSAPIENVDLVSLPVANAATSKWVMIVSLKRTDNIASTVYYMVGDFNGKDFIPALGNSEFLKFDDGASLSLLKTLDGEGADNSIALGWLDNSVDKKLSGIADFNNACTLPLHLFLYEKEGKYMLGANPLPLPNKVKNTKADVAFKSKKIKDQLVLDKFVKSDANAYDINFSLQKADSKMLEFRLYNSFNEIIIFNFDMVRNQLVVDRVKSGVKAFESFAQQDDPVQFDFDKLADVRIVIDNKIMEIYINGGRCVATYDINTIHPFENAMFISRDGKSIVKNLSIHALKR